MIAKFHVRRSLLFAYLFLALGVFSSHPTLGQASITNVDEALRISGHYSYIYENGAPAETNNFYFIALMTANKWSISVTNENNSKDWGMIRYDDADIYTLGTELGNKSPGHVNAYEIYGFAYPGQFYMPEGQDSVHLFFPWMVFHLMPQVIQPFERKGVIEMPPLWSARSSLLDYGYKWKIRYFENNRIIRQIDVVRDSALDLKTEEDELRRGSLDYPFSYSPRDHRLEGLRLRKDVPNGFVRATYECEDVLQTNDWLIPSAAGFALYWPNFKDPHGPSRLVFKLALQVNQIKLLQNAETSEAIPFAKTYVFDYRYQVTNSRTKFNRATYTINAGDSFPSGNDPKLLAQAGDWLKHGPAYGGLQSTRRKILIGMLTVTLVTSGLLVFWLRRNKNTK